LAKIYQHFTQRYQFIVESHEFNVSIVVLSDDENAAKKEAAKIHANLSEREKLNAT